MPRVVISGRKLCPFGPITRRAGRGTEHASSSTIWKRDGCSTLSAAAHHGADDRDERHDQQAHHEERGNHLTGLEMEAERRERRGHDRTQQRVDRLHDPQRMFELLHFLSLSYAPRPPRPVSSRRHTTRGSGRPARNHFFFERRRPASMAAAATTEDAPANRPNGCRRKRAIRTVRQKSE